ncbi:efflux RND transporter periplasmic adaptor subunit [Candidatus Kaiserbacteria bacterium]|nr:efflux RND transporter periplasmic adaptor subunit [Candidatus Kaiserbacteria bacterium]
MQKILAHIRANAVVYGGIIVVLLGGWLLFSNGKNGKEELLTVTAGAFVQEVSVSGKVIAAQNVDLGFSQGGRVAGVYAKVGQPVQAGTTLAELDNGDLRAGVLQKQAALEREKASLALLNEGTRSEEVEVAISEVKSDEIELAQKRNSLVEAVKAAFSTSDDAVRNTIDQFIDSPRIDPQIAFLVSDIQLESKVESTRLAMERELSTWQRNVEGLAADAALPSAVSEAQYNLSQVSLLLTDANAALNKAVPTGTNTQAVIDGYESDVAAARSAVNAAASTLTSAITAEKNLLSALETSRKNLTLKEAGTRASDIVAQEADVKAAEADLANARAQLGKTIMRAPFAGVVTKMDLKVGSIASANVSDVSMISTGAFEIESFVPEVNIALIEVGDPGNVTLDAYGADVVFTARVVSIDPAETLRDGVSMYRTFLQFEEQDGRVKSGMTANVVITTDQRAGVISVPQGLFIERDGKKYVRVKIDGEFIEREITTGAVSNVGNVEILSGLTEGEIIVLLP